MFGRHRRLPLFPYTTLFRSPALCGESPPGSIDVALGLDDLLDQHRGVAVGRQFGADQQILAIEIARCLGRLEADRKSTRLNSSHQIISYAVFCLKKKKELLE